MVLAATAGPITIKPASLSDIPVIAAMHGKVFPKGWTEADICALLNGAGAIGFLALDGQEPAAFLLAREIEGQAEIISIATAPGFRRNGLARAMLERLHNKLRARECETVFLEVDEANADAICLYDAAGYRRVGLRQNYYKRADGSRSDALLLKKALTI